MIHITEAKNKFTKHLEKTGKSSHTIRSYERNLDELINFLLEIKRHKVHLVRREDLEKFLSRYIKKNKSPKSINARTVAVKSFFKFLELNEFISKNPASALKYLKEKESEPRILSVVEYKALRDSAKNDKRYFAIIELMLQTGIKVGEAVRIRTKDIRRKESKLDVLDEKLKISRTIPLNSPAKKAMEEYLKVRPRVKSEIFFITRNGKSLDQRNVRMSISNYYKKAGIYDACVHDLRHTFCAHHIKKGTSLVAIAYMAGHKNLNTTKKYLEYIEKPQSEDLEKNAL
ncbi:hypothetical protein COX95_00880 [bacterium CG_4_10_14_0_2_um_filter_33_32]|nr:MAG: hypothetical protein AUJ93_01245 [bacterium CG2_30_33_46]PIU76893.1 MAG: hypothetical protein COS74_01755 [bacterium CG06_land_8_20_14_3_00_33_50]PIW81661.1 MAG: hypothetical protein COZ97_00495 [bacterium CG_4_8_14_3_um_filter_33_28]PIY84971.1 MAG: hypothetical protein COY76_04490 [bacterium CG_4_10_14_0_8_um_filter_33_57]PIZ86531.1 MAG: hypothetical protein COX95_00880 [bacterium CG_4_10_14_0_2_um_filter_33_32]